MKIKYWTIRVVPSAMNISSIGVGVLAQQPDNPLIHYRFVSDNDAVLKAFGLSDEVSAALRDFCSSLDAVMTENDTLDFGSQFTAPGLLSHLTDHWNNMIVVDQPRVMAEESVETALDLLFRVLIGERQQPIRQHRAAQIRRMVKEEYSRHASLEQALTLTPTLHTDGMEREIDLAVIEEENVYELNSSFSFDTTSIGQLQDKVEAWTWKIEKLRRAGATLSKSGRDIAAVHREADIVTSLWLPRTEKQKELFETITKQWDHLGVIQVAKENIPHRATELVRKIAS